MTKTESPYVTRRAIDLAVVYLTRRDDLAVSPQDRPEDSEIDLLVKIRREGQFTGRIFGVRVKGSVSTKRVRGANGRDEVRVPDEHARWAESIPFPVCLFLFTMPDDRGYFRWIKEPVVLSDGGTRLRLTRGDHLAELTNEEIDRLVASVDEWYDRQVVASATA